MRHPIVIEPRPGGGAVALQADGSAISPVGGTPSPALGCLRWLGFWHTAPGTVADLNTTTRREVPMAKPQTVHRLELVPPPRRSRDRTSGQRQVVDVTLRTSDRMLLSVEEAADRLGIGRTTMWALLRRGEVASVHVGRLRRIEPAALAAYIASRRQPNPDPAA